MSPKHEEEDNCNNVPQNMKTLFSNKDLYDAGTSSSEEDVNSKRKSRKKLKGTTNKVTSSDAENSNSSSSRSRSNSPDCSAEAGREGSSSAKRNPGKQQPHKEKKQSRKAKENAMKEIYSEKTRMLRESKVGLPYHRPRQRTLDDFLGRKKMLTDVLPILGGIKVR